MKRPKHPIVTVAEAGECLGVSRSTFFEEVRSGRWDFAKVPVGKETRLSWPAIEAFLLNPGVRAR